MAINNIHNISSKKSTLEVDKEHYKWLLELAVNSLERADVEDSSWNHPTKEVKDELEFIKYYM